MFAQRVKELRKQHQLTQRALGEALGITEQAYQLYEYGRQKPGIDRLIELADFFDVSLDYLVGRSDTP
ncbi:MAG: helix-turn-helix domain-containing protein [Oscillospiraceae bacterium]|nr:helix-turn-helix domain-containing protein [Oscillospiraceae bacterium]